jgi:NitT/TauT family transport system permease protein
VFAIFTSQAWNMTFSFYQSERTVPTDLVDAALIYRLPPWQRFTKLELPNGMIGLVWNTMMSFGGGWFFVSASETISVLNKQYVLPGIGSYLAEAIAEKDFRALFGAAIAMAVMILIVDQLVWRPLVAWADKFKFEQSEAKETPRSWLLRSIQSARMLRVLRERLSPAGEVAERALSGTLFGTRPQRMPKKRREPWRYSNVIYNGLLIAIIVGLGYMLLQFIFHEVGLRELGQSLDWDL